MNENELGAQGFPIAAEHFGKDCLSALELSFLESRVAELGMAPPICIEPGESVAAAIAQLRRLKVGCVLVVEQGGALAGIFSERDCILKVFGVISDYEKALVGDFMTPHPVTGTLTMSVAFALNIMSQGGFRHIPIVDERGRVQGVLSVKDIIDAITAGFLKECSKHL